MVHPNRMKDWARRVKRDALALWIAARDPRTPFAAKLLAAALAAYAFSPIDLIPDVIPILGLLDDLLIIPLGILLAVRLIPPALMQEFRARAAETRRPRSLAGAVVIVTLWVAALAVMAWWLVARAGP